MEQKKLTVDQYRERVAAGLSVDNCEIVKAPKPNNEPVVESESAAIRNLRIQKAAGVISCDTYGRKLLQELKTPGGTCLCSGVCSCSVKENQVKSLREAACKHPMIAGSRENDLDVIAICEGNAVYLVDHGRDLYFRADFKAGVNNEPTIVGVEEITPAAMVKEKGDLLHSVLRENLMNFTEGGLGPKLRRLCEHLSEHESTNLLLG
jgi:hypothetical protein